MSTVAEHRTPAPPTPDLPAVPLARALGHFKRVMERTSAQLAAHAGDDLDRAGYAVLLRLIDGGPQRLSALAETLLADPSTVSRHISVLVGRGLVERSPDPADGRASLLSVTEPGRTRAMAVRRRQLRVVDTVVAEWTAADREQLAVLLARFASDLERHRPHLLVDLGDSGSTQGD